MSSIWRYFGYWLLFWTMNFFFVYMVKDTNTNAYILSGVSVILYALTNEINTLKSK